MKAEKFGQHLWFRRPPTRTTKSTPVSVHHLITRKKSLLDTAVFGTFTRQLFAVRQTLAKGSAQRLKDRKTGHDKGRRIARAIREQRPTNRCTERTFLRNTAIICGEVFWFSPGSGPPAPGWRQYLKRDEKQQEHVASRQSAGHDFEGAPGGIIGRN